MAARADQRDIAVLLAHKPLAILKRAARRLPVKRVTIWGAAMNKSGKIGLTAAAFMACTAGAASAGTIIAATRTSTGMKPFAATQTFPAFGALVAAGEVPAGSILTGVKDTLTDILAGSVAGNNTGLGSGVFTLAAQDNASKTIAGVLTVDTMTVGNIVSGTLAGGASFSEPSTGTSSASVTSTSATVLAALRGDGDGFGCPHRSHRYPWQLQFFRLGRFHRYRKGCRRPLV
jgi:hypothetical protein